MHLCPMEEKDRERMHLKWEEDNETCLKETVCLAWSCDRFLLVLCALSSLTLLTLVQTLPLNCTD